MGSEAGIKIVVFLTKQYINVIKHNYYTGQAMFEGIETDDLLIWDVNPYCSSFGNNFVDL